MVNPAFLYDNVISTQVIENTLGAWELSNMTLHFENKNENLLTELRIIS